MAFELFHWVHNGTEFTLPKFKHAPIKVIRKVRSLNEAEQIFTVLEAMADDATLDIIDMMEAREFNDFSAAWQKDASITAGESSASAS